MMCRLNIFSFITCKELSIMSSQYAEAKQLCVLKQSEIERCQEIKSALYHQLQLNEEAIAHLTQQIKQKHEKGKLSNTGIFIIYLYAFA